MYGKWTVPPWPYPCFNSKGQCLPLNYKIYWSLHVLYFPNLKVFLKPDSSKILYDYRIAYDFNIFSRKFQTAVEFFKNSNRSSIKEANDFFAKKNEKKNQVIYLDQMCVQKTKLCMTSVQVSIWGTYVSQQPCQIICKMWFDSLDKRAISWPWSLSHPCLLNPQ